jgi:tyrosyl-tRNA synthetase
MWKYYLLCTDLTPAEVSEVRASVESGAKHPMEAKKELAKSIIRDFHDEAAAETAESEFRRVFSDRQAPTEVEETTLEASAEPLLVSKIVTLAKLAESNKDAQRLIAQGGVLVDDVKVDSPKQTLDAGAGKSYLLKVGKRRFARITFQ